MSDAIIVTTTFARKEEAFSLGKLLLGKRLIACAQITAPVQSLYWWKGEIEQAEEYCLVMKSSGSCWKALEKEIRLNHSYDVPEILAVPATAVSEDYEQWLLKELHS